MQSETANKKTSKFLEIISDRKKETIMYISVFVIAIICLVLGAYLLSKTNSNTISYNTNSTPTPTSTKTTPTPTGVEWKQYYGVVYPYSLKYPTTWKADNTKANNEPVKIGSVNYDNSVLKFTTPEGYSITLVYDLPTNVNVPTYNVISSQNTKISGINVTKAYVNTTGSTNTFTQIIYTDSLNNNKALGSYKVGPRTMQLIVDFAGKSFNLSGSDLKDFKPILDEFVQGVTYQFTK